MLTVGIDIGGTDIKMALIQENGTIFDRIDIPTNLPRPAECVTQDIINAILQLANKNNATIEDMAGIGIGCPGVVDSENGIIKYANNLAWTRFEMADFIEKSIGVRPIIHNDANAAAYGESICGIAKNCKSAVILTLGTGVGSGLIMNGALHTGCDGRASEIGHMIIADTGETCTCGNKGCFESYASATALINMTRKSIANNTHSKLYDLSDKGQRIDGKTAFTAARMGDACGIEIVNQYIGYLACGIANIINMLRPEVVGLSGGVSNEGDYLLKPLRAKVNDMLYGGYLSGGTQIERCLLGNNAGMIGAAMLAYC